MARGAWRVARAGGTATSAHSDTHRLRNLFSSCVDVWMCGCGVCHVWWVWRLAFCSSVWLVLSDPSYAIFNLYGILYWIFSQLVGFQNITSCSAFRCVCSEATTTRWRPSSRPHPRGDPALALRPRPRRPLRWGSSRTCTIPSHLSRAGSLLTFRPPGRARRWPSPRHGAARPSPDSTNSTNSTSLTPTARRPRSSERERPQATLPAQAGGAEEAEVVVVVVVVVVEAAAAAAVGARLLRRVMRKVGFAAAEAVGIADRVFANYYFCCKLLLL
jgi:hypothetical protein